MKRPAHGRASSDRLEQPSERGYCAAFRRKDASFDEGALSAELVTLIEARAGSLRQDRDRAARCPRRLQRHIDWLYGYRTCSMSSPLARASGARGDPGRHRLDRCPFRARGVRAIDALLDLVPARPGEITRLRDAGAAASSSVRTLADLRELDERRTRHRSRVAIGAVDGPTSHAYPTGDGIGECSGPLESSGASSRRATVATRRRLEPHQQGNLAQHGAALHTLDGGAEPVGLAGGADRHRGGTIVARPRRVGRRSCGDGLDAVIYLAGGRGSVS
jgi:hypothetical protein